MSARFGDFASRTALVGLALATVAMLAPQSFAAPIVWSVDAGGNGHSYEFVRLPNNQSWDESKAAAEAMSLSNGDVGYLTTITSAEEQAFIQSAVLPSFGVHKNQVWVGGRQEPEGAARAAALGWQWIVNVEVAPESWNYTNWLAENEPSNDGEIDERFLSMWVHFYQSGQDMGRGKWNDEQQIPPMNAVVIGMIVEYSVPEPTTALLAALGVALLALRSRRA